MKKIQMNIARYPEDVERIQKILADRHYEASLVECEALWDKFSDSMAAGWMMLDEADDDVFRCISPYIVN